MRFWSILAMAAAMFASDASLAQEAPRSDDIVVRGSRVVPVEDARRFVRQISSSVETQLRRFDQPMCPGVIGLPDKEAAIIVRRLRRIAQHVGARLEREQCAPNLILIAAKDADRFVGDLHRGKSDLFGGVRLADVREAMRPGPVHAWNRTLVLNEDSQPASGTLSDGRRTGGRPGQFENAAQYQASQIRVKTASIINTQTRKAIAGAVVVIDNDALVGKSLMQIADYVAMRAFGGGRPTAASSDTILTLFDEGAAPPLSVSLLDKWYLEALFSSRAYASGAVQRDEIAQAIARKSKEYSKGLGAPAR